uniref:Protein PXR1-like n=1 Tax=Ciona intestinalis TaxID=7719 RepID=A0A1W2WN42_CIOIN|nr:protein PXR1-like [Ciona intestinalis]XP_009857734.1 protein PXR1-like [Ciona intestinalis]|eukprot:XP_002132098.1 protein PXR1-like [Ciona intestinalis]
MGRYRKVLHPRAGQPDEETEKYERKKKKKREDAGGVDDGKKEEKKKEGSKKKKEKVISSKKSGTKLSENRSKRKMRSKEEYKVESGDSINLYGDNKQPATTSQSDSQRRLSRDPQQTSSVFGHIQQSYFRNKNINLEQDEGYRVVLIPGDNPGVKWVTAVGLLGATILLFTVWGLALNYILTPVAPDDTNTETMSTTAGY